MLRRLRFVAALWLASLASAWAEDGGRYGEVAVVAPAQAPRGLVIVFSNVGALQPTDRARLQAIADAGAIAVGVDTDTYVANLMHADPGCLTLFTDAETLSRQLQREHPAALYRVPIVAGEGVGGALAGAIVAQSPLQTVGAAVSLDPTTLPPSLRELCPRPLEADDRQGAGTPDLPNLKNPWLVALSPATPAAVRAHFAEVGGKIPRLRLRELSAAPDAAAFAALLKPFLAPDRPTTIDGLPLVELPAATHTRRMAVFISGDGGWRDVDKRVSEKLQQLGVSVVGWDSLRYFWRRKSPDQTADDLLAVLTAYAKKWDCDEVALVGFSFGADVMPFLYDRLDEDWRRRIALMALLSPGPAADWEIQVAGWLGAGPSAAATPLAPTVAAIPGDVVQCFYGKLETDNSCGLFAAKGAEVFEKTGGHHMDDDYDLIATQIFNGFLQRTSGK